MTQTPAQPIGLSVDDLARALAGAEVLSGRSTAPWDQLDEAVRDRHRKAARDVLGRCDMNWSDQSVTEAHPTEQRFRVEIHDGGQWMPAGSPTQHRQIALDALAARRAAAKNWAADGEPVRWRVVRETTTYTVEDET
ncbi:hypothetical protein ACH492_22300 [Streptomyces sp. NPDC019443]|uniref:hypothetical protein n=1 Tax=Streptomyces sp. NPDC019443 TaxID=3365061 RepID=UPI0037A00C0C